MRHSPRDSCCLGADSAALTLLPDTASACLEARPLHPPCPSRAPPPSSLASLSAGPVLSGTGTGPLLPTGPDCCLCSALPSERCPPPHLHLACPAGTEGGARRVHWFHSPHWGPVGLSHGRPWFACVPFPHSQWQSVCTMGLQGKRWALQLTAGRLEGRCPKPRPQRQEGWASARPCPAQASQPVTPFFPVASPCP